MLSLHENQHISAYVLDAWSTMLNARENLRSSHSLCRMFARAYDCVHSWVGELTPKKDRPVILNDAVEFALAGFPDNISIEHVELFFFPIMQPRHCYVICFNRINQQWENLDASTSTLKVADKYSEMPSILVKGLKKAKAKKVVMNWRHENNEYECNVLTMRLVDIYMGQGSKGWDIGIKNGDKKHMAAILSAECNEMKKTMWKRLRSMQK
ncbi:unnamed protein product [Cuscuta europaea]|uniref:Ubiquitin-like protease family profile domain-containing protein n=1 Tax=Cuscuta europaea TaxID=41803 RepID=A0A9P0Z9Z2_CUSEU|nr:unnamed protein product [Cuscuta europaea]